MYAYGYFVVCYMQKYSYEMYTMTLSGPI